MWLDRLPPEYRRRYYTNLAVISSVLIFLAVVVRLGKRAGTDAILGFIGFLLVFMCAWPLVRLLRCNPRPHRIAFVLYATWILAYAYVCGAFFVPSLAVGVPFAALLGLVLMWVFFIVYRKVIFPDFFGGALQERWRMVREAQRAERRSSDLRR